MSVSNRKCSSAPGAYFERTGGLNMKEGLRKGLAFKPRGDDVLFLVGSKSGMTWTQQIVHGLRSGRSMDFEDLDTIIPFIEYFYDHNGETDLDQHVRQHAPPRPCATQVGYEWSPKGFDKWNRTQKIRALLTTAPISRRQI